MRQVCNCINSTVTPKGTCSKCGDPFIPETLKELQKELATIITRLRIEEEKLKSTTSTRSPSLHTRDKRNLVEDIEFMLDNVVKNQ